MGLTGHAWHFRLGAAEGVVALPSGPLDLDWDAMTANYGRLGWRWERFGARLAAGGDWSDARMAAVEFARRHLDAGRPLIGFDFHLREFGIVRGYDDGDRSWLVDDLLAGDYGSSIAWEDWPSPEVGWLELIAPVAPHEPDPIDVVRDALETAAALIEGEGPGGFSGRHGMLRWCEALEGETTVDRAGNAYTIAVTLAARSDGAAFLADVGSAIPELRGVLARANEALGEEVRALAPLASLFPFPAGGHGNVDVPGLRRAAAMAIRRAANAEARLREALVEAGAAMA